MPKLIGFAETPFINDTLLAGDDYNTESRIVAAGHVLPQGQLLGRVTATGEVVPLAPAAVDGSQNVYAVLADAVDTSAGAYATTVYLSGAFKESGLTPTITPALKDALRAINTYTYPSV